MGTPAPTLDSQACSEQEAPSNPAYIPILHPQHQTPKFPDLATPESDHPELNLGLHFFWEQTQVKYIPMWPLVSIKTWT